MRYRQAFDLDTCEDWAERQAIRETRAERMKSFDRHEKLKGATKHRGDEKRNKPVRVQQ